MTNRNAASFGRLLVVLLLLFGTAVVVRPAPARADLQPAAGQYVPLTPARILSATPVEAASVYSFNPLGRGGVPTSGVSAIAFNLTARSAGAGHLTAYPAATTRPGTSTVSYRPNLNIANSAVVPIGAGNQVSIYNSSADTPVQIYVDITGYLTTAGAGAAGSTYVPLTPARVANGLAVTAGGNVAVAPLGLGGIPAGNVSAVLAHITVTSSEVGSISVYPDGTTRPGTSTLNYQGDPAYTNQVPAALGDNGQFRIYSNRAATLTVDVVGYYQTPAGTAAGSSFVGLTPARVLSNVTLGAGATESYPLAGMGGIPASGVAATALVHVGAPGLPEIFAFPNAPRPPGVTVPIVGLDVYWTEENPVTDKFLVRWEPVEPGTWCNSQTKAATTAGAAATAKLVQLDPW